MSKKTFRQELTELINRYSLETVSDTPDFVLAQYLLECLGTYNRTIAQRKDYWGVDDDASKKI